MKVTFHDLDNILINVLAHPGLSSTLASGTYFLLNIVHPSTHFILTFTGTNACFNRIINSNATYY